MSWLRDQCPQCEQGLINSRFDATFRLADATERLCFAVPAALCKGCHQLYIDPELVELLDVSTGRCVFAIETDRVMQERTWADAA